MALIRWEPVPMNRLFNNLFDTPTVASAPARRFAPATDLIESDTHYILRADLPGLSEDDVNIELDGNVLSVSGERKSEHEHRGQGYYRVERSYGSFRRSLRLPEGVDAEAIKATFDKGVLEITVPKPEAAKPHKVQITVGATSRRRSTVASPPRPPRPPTSRSQRKQRTSRSVQGPAAFVAAGPFCVPGRLRHVTRMLPTRRFRRDGAEPRLARSDRQHRRRVRRSPRRDPRE